MLDELLGEITEKFSLLLAQLGWSDLTGLKVLVLVLAFLGALSLLRRLLGGGSSTSSSTVVYPTTKRDRGLPTDTYTTRKELGDFSLPKEVYNFRAPSPEIDTSGLTKPSSVDLGLASKLFVGNRGSTRPALDWNLASKLFLGNAGASTADKDREDEN